MTPTQDELLEALRVSAKDSSRHRAETEQLRYRAHEPIAIVGMACRYPGGVATPAELWRLVSEEVDATSRFPEDRGPRWQSVFNPDPNQIGSSYVRRGGFIAEPGHFDAEFFDIGPREALAMDPQQRLLLEAAWESLEDGAIDPLALRGSDTAMFVGVSSQDYGVTGPAEHAPPQLEGYLITGRAGSVVSGRVAHRLGLEGGAVTVDTACSSSLVALHLACQALRHGECSLALAGGVTVMAAPTLFVEFSRQRGLAPDGRCKSYADGADGTGWSEGVGVLALERLSDAQANGRNVLAVVRGSAVNQDGASNGLTAPSGRAQERVIRQALANAGLGGGDVDAVEGHGTGTVLGDPIEAQALMGAYGQDRREGRPLWLGSVKANFGHAQAAAGVAGVIKMVEAMRWGRLPRTLHVDRPSSKVDWSAGEIELLSEAIDWPDHGEPRRAAVSSFGISGTNAHVIVEAAPPVRVAANEPAGAARVSGSASISSSASVVAPAPAVFESLPLVPWVLSGRSEAALAGQAARLSVRVAGDPALGASDVGLSLAGRSAFEHRAVLLGRDREELMEGVAGLARPGLESVGGAVSGVVSKGATAFLFTGQGAQWAGMGAGLYRASPVFRGAFDETCALFDEGLGRSLREVVLGGAGAGLLDQTMFTQAALFALEVSLSQVLLKLGVRPDFLIGHSVGELAAAHVAGVFSLEDACRLVLARGRLMGELPAGGAMVALQGSEREAVELLAGHEASVALAAVNGPSSVVVSGDEDAVEELAAVWRERGRKVRRLRVSHAFHSPRMDAMLDEFGRVAGEISFAEPQLTVVSNVTGEPLSAELACSPEYWVRHVREPVRLLDGARWLRDAGATRYLEVGPDAVLTTAVHECLTPDPASGEGVDPSGAPFGAVASMRRERPEVPTLLRGLSELWAHGETVDWAAMFTDARPVSLPTYAFQRERYWLEPPATTSDPTALGQQPTEHPLLTAAVSQPEDRGWMLTGRLSLDAQPWLADHVVMGSVLVPGAALLELAVEAGRLVGCERVEELTLHAPLALVEGEAAEVRAAVTDFDDGGWAVAIHSRPAGEELDEPWTLNASGRVAMASGPPTGDGESMEAWPPPGAELLDVDDLYAEIAAAGLEYGGAFQGLRRAWRSGGDIYAEIELADQPREEAARFAIHPALLDAALHAALLDSSLLPGGEMRLPFCWSGVTVHARGASNLRVRISAHADAGSIRLTASDEHGTPVIDVEMLSTLPVSAQQLKQFQGGGALYRLGWTAVTGETPVAGESSGVSIDSVALLGAECSWLADSLARAGVAVSTYADVRAFTAALGDEGPIPDALVIDGAALAGARSALHRLLEVLQACLADQRLGGCRFVVITRGAVSVAGGDGAPDCAQAAVWGFVRSAQSEYPGRLVLVDVDREDASLRALALGLGSAEPQIALRSGEAFIARLASADGDGALSTPDGPWTLAAGDDGTLESLSLVESPELAASPGEGLVRVGVCAAGLNFRDVLIALGVYPGGGAIGGEGVGIVQAVGPGVEGLVVGDRVMGLLDGGFGPVAFGDHRSLVRVPRGLSLGEAATVPIAFLTAYYALRDLAGVKAAERLLVHSAAGGVGMAAVQLARHWGVKVFATASPAKHHVLEELFGLEQDSIASSRSLEFAESFGVGGGVDVVLNSLAGEFIDASLGLLGAGGRFVEMGKTDLRSVEDVAARHPGVSYRAFDLMEAGPERLGEMLGEIAELFEEGVLSPLPVTGWDVRRAPDAFRFMSQAGHVGKNVLTMPASIDPDGTVLITGGTGALGSALARHLVTEHGVRHLVLASRRGDQAAGAPELEQELEGHGASVRVVACDVAEESQLAALLAEIPPERPLRGVIHVAGVIDDGVLETMTREQLDRVFAAKAEAAWNLHRQTLGCDLTTFVMFSSAAGVLGAPGQANYAAANAFLDALAARRRAAALPGVSIAWGPWETTAGMTATVDERDIARMGRSGMLPLDPADALDLFDTAHRSSEALLLAARLDRAALRRHATQGTLPSPLRGLIHTPSRAALKPTISLATRLEGLPANERERALTSILVGEINAVLGHHHTHTIDSDRTFKELGFDSLTAIELRNRLNNATGQQLPATLIYDHPTTTKLAGYLLEHIGASEAEPAVSLEREFERVQATLAALAPEHPQRRRISSRLQNLLLAAEPPGANGEDLQLAGAEEVFAMIDQELGQP
ncbi:MAG TPA: type I polyketide synthase [Solirubrobacteraceae bacterium]|nr:type I polyketide synthase [Solirubrobacteraceae bacterium]